MKILITNDDSINAPGLRALIDCALPFGEVAVVAPADPQSGKSSAITVDMPLRIKEVGNYHGAKLYTVNGTPVDCVKLALHAICREQPNLLLSGINHGSNSGNAIIYSGTMGAVIEGCMSGITSAGFSLLDHSISADFSLSSHLVKDIIAKVVSSGLPENLALNVNIPSKIIPKGYKVCRAARGYWTDEYASYNDPFNRPFFMLTGHFVNIDVDSKDTDEYWLKQGYASIVPVLPDMTDHSAISSLHKQFT